MPLSDCANAIPVVGESRISRLAGSVRVVQSEATQWMLITIGIIASVVTLLADSEAIELELPGDHFGNWFGLDRVAINDQMLGLAFVVIVIGGVVFRLMRHKELLVDLERKRYCFTTGFGPWKKLVDYDFEVPLVMEIQHKPVISYVSQAAPGATVVGLTEDGWELGIAIPGRREQLFIGRWTDRQDVLCEVEAWRDVFRTLVIRETPS